MVRVKREGAALDEVSEMADTLEGGQQLSIIRWPGALMRFQLGTVECKRFPSLGTSLLEDAADC